MALRAPFKGMSAAGEDVGQDAGGERNDVLDDAGGDESEHAERDRTAIAAEIGEEAEKAFPGGRLGSFFRAGGGAESCGGGAHRSTERAVVREGDSRRKCS